MQLKKYISEPNVFGAVAVILLVAVIGFFVSQTSRADQLVERDLGKARVVEIVRNELPQTIRLDILDQTSRRVEIINDFIPVKIGDTVFLRVSLPGTQDESFQIVDISRRSGIAWLMGLFVFVTIIVAGRKGMYALLGMAATFIVIFSIIFPRIIAGDHPLLIGLVGALLILLATLYISYGLNRKSLAALAGILITLMFVGALASVMVSSLQFSGAASEEAVLLSFESGASFNLVGLILIGIIIAAVGVLDDLAVTQAVSVYTLAAASQLRGWALFKQAMTIGKDHISAVINTLVLAYTGAALPLVLLLWARRLPFEYLVSNEIIAEEIVRTLVSTSGLVLVVPITTLIAVAFVGSNKSIN